MKFEIEMKLEQTENYCRISKFQDSYYSVAKIIPENIILETKPSDLGLLIENIWKSWENTKEIRDKEILAEGAIWDNQKQELLEICQK